MKVGQRGKALTMPLGLLLGTMLGLLVMMLLSLALAWLTHEGKVSVSSLGYASMGILLISGDVSAWLAISLIKRRRIIVGVLTGSLVFLSLLGMNALFMGGHYQGVLVTAVMVYLGSLIPSVFCLKRKQRPGRKRRK